MKDSCVCKTFFQWLKLLEASCLPVLLVSAPSGQRLLIMLLLGDRPWASDQLQHLFEWFNCRCLVPNRPLAFSLRTLASLRR